ncbi:MAG: polysaccharide deacetylase family protein [Rhodocyclaceae bacterium]|jgi:peptidoglycan/xylan/chitin deacetylase (PgdA/CDA1 family)|nr:polysaccharide deacetylase family protein [Rhodocyclaceae bacterium]
MIDGTPLLFWPPLGQRLSILIFHRVLERRDPLRPNEPTAADFERMMAFFARHFVVLPLREATQRLRNGTLPKRACCITFDDGYADNLTIALPILEKYDLPATVFVATGYLDGGRMFNDAVIDAMAKVGESSIDLTKIGLGRHSLATEEERLLAVTRILNVLRYREPEQRNEDVARLLEIAHCGALPDNIMLTSAQVAELDRRGVEIGGHTVNHPILTSLDDDRARAEIVEGKRRLEEIVGHAVTAFAYPNGVPLRDYVRQHVDMVRSSGFEISVTTAHGVARRGSDVFQLPRFTPWGTSTLKWGARMTVNAWNGKAVTC